jgi:hypothetical protein
MNARATDGCPLGHSTGVKARGVASAIVVLGVLLGPRMAPAADVEAIHFRYAAPPECPAEAELLSIASDMGGVFRLAPPDEAARTLAAVIEKTDHGFSGSLSVRGVTGDERVRTVTCGRCESAVRALGLIMAMALEDAQPAPAAEEATPPPAERPPTDATGPSHALPAGEPDDSGGIAAMALWTGFSWTPTGAGVMAVSRGATRFGGVVAVTTESVDEPRYQISPSEVLALGHGRSARIGGLAAWGAPWSHDDWFGFSAEGGLRGGVVHGAVCPTAPYPNDTECTSEGDPRASPPTPRTWHFLSPYVAGTLALQVLPRLPVRPFLALTFLLGGDYRGSTSGSLSLDAGIAWRSW